MPHHEDEFGDFRLCPPRFELMRAGCPVPLEKIPFDLMVLLLERAGEAITREEITIALWGAGTFQDLDASLNTAVRKIRVALQDSPDNPRFLQTIVGRGTENSRAQAADARSKSDSPRHTNPPLGVSPVFRMIRIRQCETPSGGFVCLGLSDFDLASAA